MTPEEQDNIRRMNAQHIEKIKKQLGEIQRSFLSIKKSGLNEEILLIYLHDKTGCSKTDIKNMMYHQADFYAKLGKLAEQKP